MRKYSKLRGVMYEKCIYQTEIGKLLKKSTTWLTNRFAGKESFTVDEAYKILDYLHISHDEFVEYFPPGGYV
ncbi:MAG: hypothetical protein E7391_04065 [Ruminococcaceae bacterium]|nr:hypothetical protein [Oscillospiraceae bacterium]